MKYLHKITFLLLIVGGLNWAIFALSGWDIGSIFGGMDSMAAKLIYILVGLSAVVEIATHMKKCKECGKAGASSM
jgi:uncharacterized protein